MIRKAVIPAAGYGTRFLPATKSQPKEMLPIVDTPVIQYVVEEAVASGITDILMIIGKGKRAIEEHFDRHFDLEGELERKGRMAEAEEIRRVSTMANIHFIWQREMNGLGDAIRYARHHVGDEPFVVMLGDTLLEDHTRREPITRQMVDLYERYGESVVAMEEVPEHKVHRYGIVDGEPVGDHVWQIRDLIEKPTPEEAPSRMAIAGRYILTPDIFDHLEQTPPGKNGEIQLTDAMRRMVRARPMYGLHFQGTRHDIGNRLDFLRTNITFALRRPELAGALKDFLRETVEHMDTMPPGGPAT